GRRRRGRGGARGGGAGGFRVGKATRRTPPRWGRASSPRENTSKPAAAISPPPISVPSSVPHQAVQATTAAIAVASGTSQTQKGSRPPPAMADESRFAGRRPRGAGEDRPPRRRPRGPQPPPPGRSAPPRRPPKPLLRTSPLP